MSTWRPDEPSQEEIDQYEALRQRPDMTFDTYSTADPVPALPAAPPEPGPVAALPPPAPTVAHSTQQTAPAPAAPAKSSVDQASASAVLSRSPAAPPAPGPSYDPGPAPGPAWMDSIGQIGAAIGQFALSRHRGNISQHASDIYGETGQRLAQQGDQMAQRGAAERQNYTDRVNALKKLKYDQEQKGQDDAMKLQLLAEYRRSRLQGEADRTKATIDAGDRRQAAALKATADQAAQHAKSAADLENQHAGHAGELENQKYGHAGALEDKKQTGRVQLQGMKGQQAGAVIDRKAQAADAAPAKLPEVQAYEKKAEPLRQLQMQLSNIDNTLKKHGIDRHDPKAPDAPGYGRVNSWAPDALTSSKAQAVRKEIGRLVLFLDKDIGGVRGGASPELRKAMERAMGADKGYDTRVMYEALNELEARTKSEMDMASRAYPKAAAQMTGQPRATAPAAAPAQTAAPVSDQEIDQIVGTQ